MRKIYRQLQLCSRLHYAIPKSFVLAPIQLSSSYPMCSDVQNCHHAPGIRRPLLSDQRNKFLMLTAWSMQHTPCTLPCMHLSTTNAPFIYIFVMHIQQGNTLLCPRFMYQNVAKLQIVHVYVRNKDLNISTHRQRSHETVAHTTLQQLCCPDKENWLHSRGNETNDSE